MVLLNNFGPIKIETYSTSKDETFIRIKLKRSKKIPVNVKINILPEAGHSNINDVNKMIEWLNLSS